MKLSSRISHTGDVRYLWQRLLLWSLLGLGLVGLILPPGAGIYTSTIIFGIGEVQAAVDQGENASAVHDQKIVKLTQAGGMDWRPVRKGVEGSTVVRGQETNEFIQVSGQKWREVRNELISTYGFWWLALIFLALGLFYVVSGQVRLEHRTGIKILRWTLFERIMHWFVGTLFIILALSGVSLLWGRTALIPLLGKERFSAYAEVAKFLHNYLALLFIAGLLVMLAVWLRQSLFVKVDWDWFKRFGGYFGGPHVSTGKVNAGEKVWYWSLLVAGIALCISGVYLLFPNFGWERETIQLSNIVHSISSIYLIGFSFLHIYLGSIGNEGALEGMLSGKVDAGWAQQHHDLWYEEIEKHQD
ncbi:MAG: formate dehydrogenase subunit gamma [Gammaproteobacteria bacterium]|nr:formate dehydrogenase subunit gamma [Gammaproteobacteria bacterium]